MNFEELGLSADFTARLASHKILNPSPIQCEVFTPLRSGESIIGLSKTGTGKTLAYLAPLAQRYTHDEREKNPPGQTWGLILVPTRELAEQVSRNLTLLAGNEIPSVVIVGGESEKRQVSLGEKAELYVATPGRFLDLLRRRLVNVEHLRCIVFDEADRILDMGFINDIRAIRRMLPRELQLCFFSATLHFGVDEMAYEFGVEARRIGKEEEELTVEGLDHRVSFVGDHEKIHALASILKERVSQKGIVFTNYKEHTHQIVRRLEGMGFYGAQSLTSQLSQSERSRTMQAFRDGKVSLLIASDLAARGLDVQNVDFVVNMALPEDPETYVHRVGRTARAGKKGIAISLIGFEDSFRIERLEKFLGKSIDRHEFQADQLTGPLPRFGNVRPRDPQRQRPPESAHRHQSHPQRHAQATAPQHPRAPLPSHSHPHARGTKAPVVASSRPVAPAKALKETESILKRALRMIKSFLGKKAAPVQKASQDSQSSRAHTPHARRSHQGHPRRRPGADSQRRRGPRRGRGRSDGPRGPRS
jgi:ATP-dependent RNA helicase RhlE